MNLLGVYSLVGIDGFCCFEGGLLYVDLVYFGLGSFCFVGCLFILQGLIWGDVFGVCLSLGCLICDCL